MSGYLTSSDPEVPHILTAPNAGVDAKTTEVEEVEEVEEEVEPVGYDATDYTYNPVPDPVDHEMPTDDLHRMEVPRHDRYASENTGVVPERVVPYTATMANPSYDDGGPGIGEPAAYAPGREKDLISEADAPIQVGDQVGDIRESEKIQAEKGEAPAVEDLATTPAPLATDVAEEVSQQAEREAVGYEDNDGVASAVALPTEVGDPAVHNDDPDAADDAGRPPPPTHAAPKADWVEYILANYEISREAVEAMTKAELVETYGD